MGLRKIGLAIALSALPTLSQASSAEGSLRFPNGAGCGTQEVWVQKMGMPLSDAQACAASGPCDLPGTRDSWIPDSTTPITYVRMVVHILRNDDGSNPISTPTGTQTIIDNLNNDFLPSRIQFETTVNFVNSTAWRNLSESEIFAMKAATAIKPDSFINVWATTVDFGYSYGTFPWDSDAQTPQSGIVMGHFHWSISSDVFAHEMGHCLGLYHVFNGVDEVTSCGACYEAVNSPDKDVRGDRCSDTEPAPTISGCSAGGNDPCSGLPWGAAFNNLHSYMAYSNCTEFFTQQQMGRMHCWTNDMLSSWVSNVRIEADTQVGRVPFDVTFNGLTAKSVNSWDWDFGDGGGSATSQPVHTYATPGLYDVSVTIQTNDGPFTTTRSPFVAAHADSVDPIDIDAAPGDTAFVNIYCRNYVPVEDLKIPFTWAGPLGLALVDFRTAGLRSAGMGTKSITSYIPGTQQAAYRIAKGAGAALAPGTGPILTLVFIVPEGATGGPNPISIESYSGQTLQFQSAVGSYEPTGLTGQVSLDLGICGDINNDGLGPNIQDLNYLVAYVFNGGPIPPNPDLADVNASGGINVLDLNYLIAFFFNGGPLPTCL